MVGSARHGVRRPRKADSRYSPVVSSIGAKAAVALTLVALLALAVAPSAMAADGVGLWGRTDDRVITYWAFGVIAFFIVLVIALSVIQIRLESRKERMQHDLERLRRQPR